MRADGRATNQLRTVRVVKNYTKYAEGCCLISFGQTRVHCAATVEDGVPPFLKNTGSGWVTAEYGMLPRSCVTRIKRNVPSGRVYEIQRLIGRSLRTVVNLDQLGERTIKVDCDVIQADGGTRTAAVTGGFIALALALKYLKKHKVLKGVPLKDYVAAVSVGIVDGAIALDLDYAEDSRADVDMNVVMLGRGAFVEVQGTAERAPFLKDQVDQMLSLARKGIQDLVKIQQRHLGEILGVL